MGGVDLVDGEVLVLLVVRLDDGRQVDGGPLGGGTALTDPAHAAIGEHFRGVHGDVGAGERPAVPPDQIAHAVQLDAGGERLHHILPLGRLQPEEGLPPRGAGLQNGAAGRLPADEILGAQALQDLRRGLEELHGRDAGVGQQAFRQLDRRAVRSAIDLGQRARGLQEVGMSLPAHPERHAPGEREEAGALERVHVPERGRTALEVVARVGPGGVGHHGSELQERRPVRPVQLTQDAGRHAEAGAGEFVGMAREGVDELHEQLGLSQRQQRQQGGTDLEILGGERSGLPGAAVQLAPLRSPVRHLGNGQVLQGGRAGAEKGVGQRGRVRGQIAPGARPLAEVREGEVLQHGRADAEISAGGLPGAQRMARDGEALVRPAQQFRRGQPALQCRARFVELLHERGRESGEGIPDGDEGGLVGLGHAAHFGGTTPECLATTRVGSGKLPNVTASSTVSRTA